MRQTAFKIQAETCMSYLPFPQGIHYFCTLYCIVFLRRDWEVMSKTHASCFIRNSKHLARGMKRKVNRRLNFPRINGSRSQVTWWCQCALDSFSENPHKIEIYSNERQHPKERNKNWILYWLHDTCFMWCGDSSVLSTEEHYAALLILASIIPKNSFTSWLTS